MELRAATQAMGTRFELVLHGADRTLLVAAAEAAIDVIEAEHRRLSRFDPASLVSHLRRVAGGPAVVLDRDTWDLFADAVDVRRASRGRFDVTLGTGGATGVQLDRSARTIRLASPAVELDLGGIAKGHALDLAARGLREAGVERAFLHGGTSSGCGIGRPADRRAWRVVAAGGPGAPAVDLVDRAYSVSAWGGAALACVVGPSARLADAYATALALDPDAAVLPRDGWEAWVRRDHRWRPVSRRARRVA